MVNLLTQIIFKIQRLWCKRKTLQILQCSCYKYIVSYCHLQKRKRFISTITRIRGLPGDVPKSSWLFFIYQYTICTLQSSLFQRFSKQPLAWVSDYVSNISSAPQTICFSCKHLSHWATNLVDASWEWDELLVNQ